MRLRSFGTGALLCGLAFLIVSCATTPDVDTTPTASITVDAHVGKKLNSDGNKIEELTDEFTRTETVYAVVNVPERVDGTMKVRWLRGATQVHEQSITLSDNTHNYAFQLNPGNGGHQAGAYKFEVYVNEERKETEDFTVL